MDTLPLVEVKPIYGHGWTIAGEPRWKVPAAFTMKLERSQPQVWVGIVLTEGHEFERCQITLTQRHMEWSGHVNIEVAADRPTGGYGQLASLPPIHES